MRCKERKIRLSGEEVLFECDLLALNRDYGILKYVIEKGRKVDGVFLPDGTVTLGLYFSDRGYNLYYWIAPRDDISEGRSDEEAPRDSDPRSASSGRAGDSRGPWQRDIAYYFNIAELVGLSSEEIAYRDLVVDVLVLPDGRVQVLDETELPLDIDPILRRRIAETRDELLHHHQRILDEARTLLLPYARAL